MADGEIVSARFGRRRDFAPLSSLQKQTRLQPGAAQAFAAPLATLLARNDMLKKALDQERAASADLRWILCSRKRELPDVQDASPSASATPIGDDLVTVISLTSVAAPWAPGDLGAANLPKSPEDGGLSAGYPDFGYGLTRRQLQILGLVLAGHPSKNIAADLGISRRTVESHRAAIMHRTGATSLPALARLAVGADVGGDCKLVARS